MWQILTIILGSGLVSALATHLLTTGVAERNFRRDKLEQLYLLARKYRIRISEEGREFDDRTQWLKDHYEEHTELIRTCHMITDLYFPALKPSLEAFEADYQAIRQMLKREGGMPKDKFYAAFDAYRKTAGELLDSIVRTAQRMNRPWYRFSFRLRD